MNVSVDFDFSNCEFKVDNVDEIVSEEIEKCCYEIQKEAKYLVPVDTGNLRNSITTEVNGLSGEVGTEVEYSIFVEYGTIHMSAQPFMIPALEDQTRGLEEKILSKICEEL